MCLPAAINPLQSERKVSRASNYPAIFFRRSSFYGMGKGGILARNKLPAFAGAERIQAVARCGFFARGCTSGTAGPRACLKCTGARSNSVPRDKSASGNTTLKFLLM